MGPVGDRQVDALEAVADFVDFKSPLTLGHSRAVADLAGDAAVALSLPSNDVAAVWRAGLLHDLGRLGVSNAIWDKKGSLTYSERERVRLHALSRGAHGRIMPCPGRIAALAVQHHERLDGSGYPRGLSGRNASRSTETIQHPDDGHA